MKKYKDKVKDKVMKAKKKKPAYFKGYVKRRPDNSITAIYCKKCNVQIQGLKDDYDGTKYLGAFWNYTQVTLEMDDGSAHITPVCIKCAKDLDSLEELYVADLEELIKEDDGDNEGLWKHLLNRKPTIVKRNKNERTIQPHNKSRRNNTNG